MLPFGIQPWHLIVVAIVALLIFGPARLPEIGRTIGKAITEFRRGAKEMTESFKEEVTRQTDNPGSTIPPQAMSQPVPQPLNPTAQPATVFPSTQPAETGKQFCIHCGTANPAGAIYCNHCGSKIAE